MNTKLIRLLAPVAISLVAASGTAAQTSPQQQDRLVIHAGRLLDVKTGHWLTNQNIFIEGDKIARIQPGGPPGEAGWKLIDLSNAAVLPGLIDCHVHLTLSPSSFGYELLGISEARQTLTGAANARKTLLAGFTRVRNVGAWGFTDVALRDAVNAGDVPGPRMLVSGMPLSITGDTSITTYCHGSITPVLRASQTVSKQSGKKCGSRSSMAPTSLNSWRPEVFFRRATTLKPHNTHAKKCR